MSLLLQSSQLMFTRFITHKPLSLTTKFKRNFGFFDRIALLIQTVLNRMANQDTRQFRDRVQDANTELSEIKKAPPKNALEAERRFQEGEQEISAFQKMRMHRIDDILGTSTYFHQTRPYEQRLDSQHVISIRELKNKFKETPRWKLDAMNPQIVANYPVKHRRSFYKDLKNLRSYPSPSFDLNKFRISQNQNEDSPLLNMLGQQALFTKLSLRELDLTIESVHKQSLLFQTDDGLIESQLQGQEYNFRGKVYFRPVYSMSMFRIDSSKFHKKLLTDINAIEQILDSQIQQIFNLDQIYQCLQEYYYDERVSEYLKKIENNQLEYFISRMFLSPDANHLAVIIDLLGTKKQYVCLYKPLKHNSKFSTENVLFNLHPQFALRNGGIAYYVRRSQQGMLVQLVKCKFSQKVQLQKGKSIQQVKEEEQKQINEENQIEKIQSTLEEEIIYRCAPHFQLNIITGKQAHVVLKDGNYYISNTVLFEQFEPFTNKMNNKIIMLQNADTPIITEITNQKRGSEKMNNELPKHLKNTSNVNFIHDCFEILGVGYILVRYQQINKNDASNFLKYGSNQKVGNYISFIPFVGTDHHRERKMLTTASNALTTQTNKEDRDLELEENTYQISLSSTYQESEQIKVLDFESQELLYCCADHQYFTEAVVHSTNPNNIYILLNKSIYSVYNNNTLYIYPIRKNITPYSLYLDGYPIHIKNKTHSTKNGVLDLELKAPLLPVKFQYILWKKQLIEKINQRIYTQILSLNDEDENGETNTIKLKIISSQKFIKQSNNEQPVILYLPTHTHHNLDQLMVRKFIEKGVIFAQPISLRGSFSTDMINLIRGTKDNWVNNYEDIKKCVMYLKETFGDRVGIYAHGTVTSYITLMLNIVDNQNNRLFDCSVLHEGKYNLNHIGSQSAYFFGKESSLWQNFNPIAFKIVDPTISKEQQKEDSDKIKIMNLENILLSAETETGKEETRAFISKLRNHHKIIYDSVFLKQFDWQSERDIYNLSYLYFHLKNKMQEDYQQQKEQKMKDLSEEGKWIGREEKDGKRVFKQ